MKCRECKIKLVARGVEYKICPSCSTKQLMGISQNVCEKCSNAKNICELCGKHIHK